MYPDPSDTIGYRVRHLLANVYLYLYTIPLFAVALSVMGMLWLLTAAFDRQRRVMHLYLRGWCRLYIALNPYWKLRVDGLSNLPKTPCVMVANHQSLFDITVLLTLPIRFKWVAKRELFRAPFVGWILWLADYVSINRASRADAQRMQRECLGWLRCGVSIMIFPEGTRTRTGQVGPFKAGAFSIATAGRVPVVPIAVRGPRETLRGLLLVPRRELLHLQVLPPLRVPDASTPTLRKVALQAEEAVRAAHRRMAPYYYRKD